MQTGLPAELNVPAGQPWGRLWPIENMPGGLWQKPLPQRNCPSICVGCGDGAGDGGAEGGNVGAGLGRSVGTLDGAAVGRVGCDVGGPGTNNCTCCSSGRRVNKLPGRAKSCAVDAGISMLITRKAVLQRTPYHGTRHHVGGDVAVATYVVLVVVFAHWGCPLHSHGGVWSAGTKAAMAHSALPSC